ncbi:MAG: glutaminase family protein [Paludibacteraceae bacterium]
MKKILFLVLIVLLSSCSEQKKSHISSRLRAPAYPLINIDTYTNAWLFGDTLYNNQLSHWTGKEFPLLGVIRVDGQNFRFMGYEDKQFKSLLKTSEEENWTAAYVNDKPAGNWMARDYDDSNWKHGKSAFGKRENSNINTAWDSENIWVRREFELKDSLTHKKVILDYSHDDDVEVYINGIKVIQINDRCQDNALLELPAEATATLYKGKNVIAAHCKNKGGDAYLDFGLNEDINEKPVFANTVTQNSVEVLPLQTIYNFTCGPVNLELTFTSPLLMNNLDLLSRPINYISYKVSSNDSKSHAVNLYLEGSPAWALNTSNQPSETETFEKDGLLYLKSGSKKQQILGKKGDKLCIDWGYFYLCAEKHNTQSAKGNGILLRKKFSDSGKLSAINSKSPDAQDRFAFSRSLGKISKTASGYFMLGYDDIYSIQYFGKNLRPYWNRNEDKNIYMLFEQSRKEYKSLIKACDDFDYNLMKEAARCGGQEYAELCALAYRQSVSAHKLLQAPNGELLFLSKENFSSGGISTVDVTYPSAPLFLLYNVDLLKGMLNPIFYYVESGKWKEPFAPHDIGIYPIANGQVSSTLLPVEESGNMLILTAAIATMEGNAQYALQHWKTLSKWADFLVKKGFDPESQENTDVFTGTSAHNANLSIKAIQGIASYGRLADMLGQNEISQKYTALARAMALKWVEQSDDGDHYRFAFDQPGTWSQKYNLVWDKILKINVFPHEVPEKEVAYYLTKQNMYGLPLDSKHLYTKADWIVWSATLARSTSDFQQFISPLYKFVNETTDRIPMSDWYWTDKPEHVAFRARSVLGGYFIKMMEDKLISQDN